MTGISCAIAMPRAGVRVQPRRGLARSRTFSTRTFAASSADFKALEEVLDDYKNAPPSFKQEITADVKSTMEKLKDSSVLKSGAANNPSFPSEGRYPWGSLE
jgi:hypothetical protein